MSKEPRQSKLGARDVAQLVDFLSQVPSLASHEPGLVAHTAAPALGKGIRPQMFKVTLGCVEVEGQTVPEVKSLRSAILV